VPALAEKVAVITGAGRGFGRAVAIALAEQGSSVVLTSRSRAELAEVAEVVRRATGREPLVVVVDVGSRDGVDALKMAVERRFGGADILVNAAAVFGPVETIAHADTGEWVKTFQINAVGPFLTCNAFIGGMVSKEWGRVINVSASVTFMPPDPQISAYVVSKVALNQLTRHLAVELESTGVTANVIHPGVFKSAMWQDIKDKASAIPGETRLTSWAERVERSGGEPFEKGVAVVNRLIHDLPAISGQFCWPDSSYDPPVPTW
jgi:NAD(P)-dependent dehydrogenase (short-subunit alcohol dehydrogenase family)